MKKQTVATALLWAGGLFLLGFCLRVGGDFYRMARGLDSISFPIQLALRALCFLLPGALCLGWGVIRKHRASQ